MVGVTARFWYLTEVLLLRLLVALQAPRELDCTRGALPSQRLLGPPVWAQMSGMEGEATPCGGRMCTCSKWWRGPP